MAAVCSLKVYEVEMEELYNGILSAGWLPAWKKVLMIITELLSASSRYS